MLSDGANVASSWPTTISKKISATGGFSSLLPVQCKLTESESIEERENEQLRIGYLTFEFSQES
jgi:hypothetical protein